MNEDNHENSVTLTLSLIRSPVWLFDIDRMELVWANNAALALCNAADLNTLKDQSPALDVTYTFSGNLEHRESPTDNAASVMLTLSLNGQSLSCECYISALETPSHNRWLVFNSIRTFDSSALSDMQYNRAALLSTSVCVSMYSMDGVFRYANPSARRMLGATTGSLAERFVESQDWQAVNTSLCAGRSVNIEAQVITARGNAWHNMMLEPCSDSIWPRPVILVTELDVSARHEEQEEVQQLAYYDTLTGLPNRASWYRALNSLVESGCRSFSVLFMDLDGFKAINDTYGHDVGDKLLLAVGMRVSDCVSGDQLLARLGGDEFTLLLKNDDGSAPVDMARQILASLNRPIVIDGHSLTIALSIGISLYRADSTDCADSVEEVVQQADIAMYAAKKSNSGFACFEAHMMSGQNVTGRHRDFTSPGEGDATELCRKKSVWVKGSVIAA